MRHVGRAALGASLACLGSPASAWANNAPAPDGLFALVTIFPAALAGAWLAGVPGRRLVARALGGIGLLVLVLVAAAGTGVGTLAALGLVAWGLYRAARIARHGRRPRAVGLAAALGLLSLGAGASYFAAATAWYGAEGQLEHFVLRRVRELAEYQAVTKASRVFDANGNGIGEYGAIEYLAALHAERHRGGLSSLRFPPGYRYGVVLGGDPARDETGFLVYATPTNYGGSGWRALPGGSLLRSLGGRPPVARFTYAIDEAGVVRRRDLGQARAPTREEVRSWESP